MAQLRSKTGVATYTLKANRALCIPLRRDRASLRSAAATFWPFNMVAVNEKTLVSAGTKNDEFMSKVASASVSFLYTIVRYSTLV